ncbi:TAXI family TRAP transporter solute-binding subunit [Desertibacillus haloalkaliphilus]|uniref:TAXI family TRAP transporter solute-binding subunit n=1 Tax=Desertibacillus haloalkaliphilus TaxID=1328930 RepID=UPI001C279AA6|nr:TAXI family TRAP transporter solute-binding subunit [Desertibacillus haloalkaliphilus]MBU8907764.1 TAXI family TRAP transporter solute-binding subunit [Desertibacillus haloalkaliphilus]
MKKFLRRTLLTTITGLGLVFASACGGEDTAGTPDDGGDDAGQDTTVNYDESPSTVVIGTASQGGTYFIYGGGLASLLESELGVTANVEVTGGPVQNMILTHNKDQDIGMITLGPGYEGITGTGEWADGQTYDDVRVAFPMYTTPFHWWSLENSGVTSIDEMAGMRVGVGPAGGTSGTYLPLIHDALDLDVQPVQAGASDMTSQQMDGQLDVIGFAAGIPISAVSEVEAQRDINFFGIDGEQREQVIEEYPFFFPFTIPAETYNQLDEDLETIAMFNFGIVHKEMDPDFVYEFVKAYHENQDMLINTHSAAEEAVEDAILRNDVMPLHPGAIRYYEEVGIELPESVYPAEHE